MSVAKVENLILVDRHRWLNDATVVEWDANPYRLLLICCLVLGSVIQKISRDPNDLTNDLESRQTSCEAVDA
jgi:hypothetical protein